MKEGQKKSLRTEASDGLVGDIAKPEKEDFPTKSSSPFLQLHS